MAENVAISASILALLSLISTTLAVCIFLVFWKYRSNEKKKTAWKSSPSELRTGWLQSERKPLVPGKFSAKVVQPNLNEDNDTDEDDSKDTELKETTDNKDKHEDDESCGEIVFILRYLVDREELMVRLVQMEGFSAGENIYNADSAYVDVQLKHIGNAKDIASDSPPKLDIALQQVYYFIMSQHQLFSYKLYFKVNTFDESFRRSVSGEVQVNLFEELGRHIFTGNEIMLSKKIMPVPQHSSTDKEQSSEPCVESDQEEQEESRPLEAVTSPATSPLSWDSECNMASSASSGLVPYEDYSDGVQWHRLSGDSWDEKTSFQWPYLSESVVSVPSSFQFNANNESETNLPKTSLDHLRIEESKDNPFIRRSVSESYVSHYGRLSPPSKNFYHLVPIPLSTKLHNSPFTPIRQRHTVGHRLKGKEPVFTFEKHEHLSRKRSLSFPSLARDSLSSGGRKFGDSIQDDFLRSQES